LALNNPSPSNKKNAISSNNLKPEDAKSDQFFGNAGSFVVKQEASTNLT